MTQLVSPALHWEDPRNNGVGSKQDDDRHEYASSEKEKRHGVEGISGQRMVDYTSWFEAPLITFDKQTLFHLCFWPTRGHS